MKPLSLLEWKLLQWMAKPYYQDSRPSFHLFDGKARFHPDALKADAKKAAKVLIQMRWTSEPDNFGNIRLNSEGLAAALSIPMPEWLPPKATSLEDRDMDVLNYLEFASRNERWATPLDCGGRNGSHHSNSLVKLVHNEYAECRQRGGDKIYCGSVIVPKPSLFQSGKGSRVFRITPAGIAALKSKFGKPAAVVV